MGGGMAHLFQYQKNLQVKLKEDDDELKFCDRLLEDLMGECHQVNI